METSVLHFSNPIARLLDKGLAPSQRASMADSGSKCFPPKVTNELVRTCSADNSIDWLLAVNELVKDPTQLSLCHGLAFVCEFHWRKREADRLVFSEIHAQALYIPDRKIEDVISSPGTVKRCHYIRLDLEPRNLGTLFPDPFPHVHSFHKGPPRFPVGIGYGNPLIDFIELLIRNFDRDVWYDWACRVWSNRVVKSIPALIQQDSLAIIKSLFKDNHHEKLGTDFAPLLKAWKTAMSEEKSRMFPVKPDAILEALHY